MDDRDSSLDETSPIRFRVAVVGAHRIRVAKVVSLLCADESATHLPIPSTSGQGKTVFVEYLPCVATFDSYDGEDGKSVRYLAKVEYHGSNNGTNIKGASLAPFFDEDEEIDNANFGNKLKLSLNRIPAFALGVGIGSEEDVSLVQNFVSSLSGGIGTDGPAAGKPKFLLQCVQPNSGYSSMKEENDAYKNLGPEEKEEATRNGTIGPGKMAGFAKQVAIKTLERAFGVTDENNKSEQADSSDAQMNQDTELNRDTPVAATTVELKSAAIMGEQNETQFACKRCRSILFRESDLEDPPHSKSRQDFSKKKGGCYGGGGVSGDCESAFLAGGLDWMGDVSAGEGKFNCPKCKSKLGQWKWSGAQ
eukprot:scaffold37747_cov46-Attheya_sp.AAC.3